jgi:DtxR family Mn-dependent transcriptional regulator
MTTLREDPGINPLHEDYLKIISILADRGEVRVTDIAAHFGVTKPSVLDVLKPLEAQGFLEHARYRTVILTARGKERAAELRDRYEFLIVFFRNVLGVSQETAERDSCKIEHSLSEETLRRMRDARDLQTTAREPAKAQRPSNAVLPE